LSEYNGYSCTYSYSCTGTYEYLARYYTSTVPVDSSS
jgi:hypothetical protein